MEGLNKIISFVLGLIVVIIFFAVVTKRIDLKNIGKKSNTTTTTTNVTPTPKNISNIKISPTNNRYTTSTATPSSIPSTGLPTIFIPTLLAGLFGGSKLRNAGKKD
jgi:hypothetical protein